MKPVLFAAIVLLAFAALGDDKPQTNPHAFRMPKKTVVRSAPEAPATEAEATKHEAPAVESGQLPVAREVSPEAEAAPKSTEPAAPDALPPTAFRFPNAQTQPPTAPESKPSPKAETAKPAKPLPFVLPGQKPAPTPKKTPITFKLPEKKPQ